MKKWMFLFVLTFILNIGLSAQDKEYHKISEQGFWDNLTIIAEQVKSEGSKKLEFGGWDIYFPKRYINFVRKFEKNGDIYEYYVKVDAKGMFDAKIRFKESITESSQSYDDKDGTEKKLLIASMNDVIPKIISANAQLISSK